MSREIRWSRWVLISILLSFVTVVHAATEFNSSEYDLYAGDFNGDGRTDILYIGKTTNLPSGIVLADDSGTPQIGLQTWASTYLNIPWSNGTYKAVIGDFNGDGCSDILLQAQTSGNSYVLLANCNAAKGPVGQITAVSQTIPETTIGITWSADQHRLVAGDFDGDGKTDLFFQATSSTGTDAIVLADSTGKLFTRSSSNCGSAGGPQQCWTDGYEGLKWSTQSALVYAGDFNGDGKSDLLVQAKPITVIVPYTVPFPVPGFTPNSFALFLAQTANSAGAIFLTSNQEWSQSGLNAQWSSLTSQVVVGDFNGDGKADVILQSRQGSTLSLLLGSSSGQLQNATTIAGTTSGWNASNTLALVGTFGGGKTASLYLQATTPTGANYIASNLAGTGSATETLTVLQTAEPPPAGGTDVGRTSGTFQVSQVGSAQYNIPIFAPPGPRGLQPAISLFYDSGSGNGPLGVGWNIAGLGSITRCNLTYAQDAAPGAVALATTDGYCINGNRLRLVSGSYGTAGSTYNTEVYDGTLITAYGTAGNGPAYFTVQAPNGQTYQYGNGSGSQVLASGTTTALTWMLNEVSDAYSNTMTIGYCATGSAQASNCPTGLQGSTVPSTISWTPQSHGATTYAYTMTFNWGANVAPRKGYVAATPVVNPSLLGSIVVAYEGSQIKKYTLSYQQQSTTTGTGRDVLTQVQECSSSSSDCLTPTTMNYQSGTAGISASGTTVVSSGLSPCVTWYGSVAKYDFNGDGYTDLLYAVNGTCYVAFGSANGYGTPVSTGIASSVNGYTLAGDLLGTGQDGLLANNGGQWYYYTWNGSSFVNTPTGLNFDTTAFQFALADINGDGLPDLISLYFNGTSSLSVTTRLNTSAGSTPSFKTSPVNAYSYSASGGSLTGGTLITADTHGSKLRAFDFNGDGSQDIGLYYSNCLTVTGPGGVSETTCTYTVAALIAQNNGTFSANTIFQTQSPINPLGQIYFANVNNDACTDMIVSQSASINQIYYSACNGTAATVGAVPIIVGVMDVDGDGLDDIISTNGTDLVVNTATGDAITTSIPYNASCAYLTFDENGDGLDDLACAGGVNAAGTTNLTYYLHNGTAQPPDLLTSITDAYGNYAKPSYVALTRSVGSTYFDTNAPTPPSGYKNYFGPLYLVNQVSFNDPSGSSSGYSQTNSYGYAQTNIQGRGFAGIGNHQQYDSRNDVYTTTGVQLQFPLTGVVSAVNSTSNNQASGNLSTYAATYSSTANFNGHSGVNFVFPQTTTQTQYELGSTSNTAVTTTTTSYSKYDSFGNPGTVTKTVTDNDNYSGAPYFNDSWTTVTSYTWDESTSCSLPSQTQVAYTASVGSAVTITKTFTPNLASCNYSQVVTQPGTSLTLTENLAYDTFGNIDSDSVVGSGQTRTTTANWGTTGQFPLAVTDPSGATTRFSYDSIFGLKSGTQDPNGLVTSVTYDAFGRQQIQTNPDGTSVNLQYKSCSGNSACPALAKMQTVATTEDTAGNYINDSQTFTDAVGRTVESLSRNQNSGSSNTTYNFHSQQYDSQGRLVASSVPALQSQSNSAPMTTYSYDLLNRVTQLVKPLTTGTAATNYLYAGRITTITDAKGNQKTLTRDVNGWLRQIKDATGYIITLGYDAAGSETSVTDSAGNTLSSYQYSYGVAPFKVQATDTDLGTWTYTYDAFGELTAWKDAKGQSFAMTYDALSRPATRSEPDLFTQWTWGSSAAAHAIGQLSSVCTGTGVVNPTTCNGNGYAESATYDTLARLSDRSIQLPGAGGTYAYDFAYDAKTGLPAALTYPSDASGYRLKVQLGYTNGLASSITDVSDSPTAPLWTATAVDGRGHYLQETLGNGVKTSYAFDPNTGWLSAVTAGVGGGAALQNTSYLFDPVGNLKQRQDSNANTAFTEQVNVDAVNRLSNTVGDSNTSMSYDSIGRLSSFATNGTTSAIDYTTVNSGCTSNSQLHAQHKTGAAALCYDANGNVVSTGANTVNWTSYNQPSSVAGVQFSYDGNHQRWQQIATVNGSMETTDYIGGLLEKVSNSAGSCMGTTYRYYVPIGNNMVVYNRFTGGPNSIDYITTDHLGSTATITDSSGNLVAPEKFSALGQSEETSAQETTAGCVTRVGFTGQAQMDSVGMVNMNGRIYSYVDNHFLSPDPNIPYPNDTRSYNRYAYARYNPMTYVDPSGFDDCISSEPMQNNGDAAQEGVVPLPAGAVCPDPASPFCDANGDNCVIPLFNCGITISCFDPNRSQCPPANPYCFTPAQPTVLVGQQGGSGGGGGGGGGGSSGQSQAQKQQSNQQANCPPGETTCVPVHGPWTYGNYCGPGGKGTPGNAVDLACLQHDACYAVNGFTAGSNFGTYNSTLQVCNQTLCNAMSDVLNGASRQQVLFYIVFGDFFSHSISSLVGHPGPLPGPAAPDNQAVAAAEIDAYFSIAPWFGASFGRNACH